MTNSQNKLVFHADGSLSVRIDGRWRYALTQLNRAEYMALPCKAKKRLLLAEFETGRELIEGTRLMVSKHRDREDHEGLNEISRRSDGVVFAGSVSEP